MATHELFDAENFCADINRKREGWKLSWRDVAADTGLSPATLSRFQSERRVSLDTFVTLVVWAGLDANFYIDR